MASGSQTDKSDDKMEKHQQSSRPTSSQTKKDGSGSGAKQPKSTAQPSKTTSANPFNATGDFRLPYGVEIGPVTTVGEVLNARDSGRPVQFQERMYQPTVAELHQRCEELLDASKKKKKPAFGPERPPKEGQ